ncbi:hypothetical protein H2200_006931 [Cladophialophora chaetospira]|uniref:Uncharacterized protein n=1 Tax=Cladophialophora chaetospira TaxID=386627 RepID=A0AA38X9Q3_9EURO|nr:hypothetical protein H2200_006931 [Cladophialophora chaetospira]
MLDDLLELTTTLVHPPHEPNISSITGAAMPPRSRHTKASSIASNSSAADVLNGIVAGSPGSKASSPAATATRRRRQSRGAASPPGSPVVLVPKPVARNEPLAIVEEKVAEPLKFATTVVLSFVLEAGLQTLASTVGVGDLAAISRRHDTWNEILGLLGWKIAKLGIYWVSDFDAYDVAALTLLLSTPSALLLGLFYKISPATLTSVTLSSIVANFVPNYFLRPISPSHTPNSAPKSAFRNRPILTDPYTTIATSLLATAIFAVLLEGAFATYLPTWLILHFVGLRTLEPAHLGPAGLPTLLLALIPAGYAVQEYLFAPSTAAASSTITVAPETTPAPAFDPATATFLDHIHFNAWGWYSSRQKELIRRTALLTTLISSETVLSTWGSVHGVEIEGAVLYAGVWATGALVTGGVLNWVGGPSD